MKNKKEYFKIIPIGYIRRDLDKILIDILDKYIPALKQLENFSHVNVLWWFSKLDSEECRNILHVAPPYDHAPESGVFATRSPVRPNSIALTVCEIIDIDQENGIIQIKNIDAEDKTPVIDLKAYFPNCDRVKEFKVPDWISDWDEWFPDEGLGIDKSKN